jgi:hypothetical protein
MGFITWLIPFVASFGFYDRAGNLNVSYGMFKSVMVVVSSITGMYLLNQHMKLIQSNFMREGLITGIAWLMINYVLDLLVLVPMAGMTLVEYFTTIGLGYLQIPVICTFVGMILKRKIEWSQKS